MSDSPELETVKNCTSHLETALKVLDRELVHFLRDEGFTSDDAHDDLLNPHSTLTEAERAGELVKWIKNKNQGVFTYCSIISSKVGHFTSQLLIN